MRRTLEKMLISFEAALADSSPGRSSSAASGPKPANSEAKAGSPQCRRAAPPVPVQAESLGFLQSTVQFTSPFASSFFDSTSLSDSMW